MTRFDVIVVGSGSSGAAFATRLAQVSERNVLVLEAGPVHDHVASLPDDVLDATRVAGVFPGHPLTWTYQAELTSEVTTAVTRGKIIGGSSSVNGMIFMRGRPAGLRALGCCGQRQVVLRRSPPILHPARA